jgi:hypothetical protein
MDVLLIGGPRDGEFRLVEDGKEFINVTENLESTLVEYDDSQPRELILKEHLYKITKLWSQKQGGDRIEYRIFLHSDLEEWRVIEYLIEGYRAR